MCIRIGFLMYFWIEIVLKSNVLITEALGVSQLEKHQICFATVASGVDFIYLCRF